MVLGSILKKNIETPDKTEKFSKGMHSLVNIKNITLERYFLEPGWKWSEDAKEETESCQKNHFVYHISGKAKIRLDDGTEEEIGPGDFVFIPPGHDAWVVGNEPVVGIEIHL
jgi:quercetin dioxygenase-like cupin family protein